MDKKLKKLTKLTLLMLIIVLCACTDSAKGRLGAYGESAQITCYSGGIEIYSGKSTGKVNLSKGGFAKFTEKKSNKYIEILADCKVVYE